MRQIGYAMNGNDDFFGGPVTPPPNPALTNAREYGDFTTGVRPPEKSTASPLLPVVLIVVGILVAVSAFAGYRVMMSGTQIEIPPNLLGMNRMDQDSPVAQQVKDAMSELAQDWGEADVEVGVFLSGQRVLFVMASEAGIDSDEADEFFAGFESSFNESGRQGTLAEAEPGPRGGEMRCITVPSGGTCAWVDDDTFGTFAMTPMDGDPAATALQIREAIES